MKNIIIINLKSVFLPDCIAQLDQNTKFLAGSAQKKLENLPYFDPIAVTEIQKIADTTKAEFVISDNWFWTSDFDITENWCKANGLNLNFHKDYCTPKRLSSYRINEIQWWIESHPQDNVILILDDDYTMTNLADKEEQNLQEYNEYINKYKHYIGNKRRKSLINLLEYLKYEKYSPFYGTETKVTVCLKENTGMTKEVIYEAWEVIKKAAI